MTHEYVLWVVVLGCSIHVVEESVLDWVKVSQPVAARFGVTVTWSDFYVVNAAMIFGAIAGAMIGWRSPAISLMIPALTVVNAVIFHVAGSLVMRRFVPGTITAVLVYLPIAAWTYVGAGQDGVLTAPVILLSSLGGVLLMAFPVIMLWLRARLP